MSRRGLSLRINTAMSSNPRHMTESGTWNFNNSNLKVGRTGMKIGSSRLGHDASEQSAAQESSMNLHASTINRSDLEQIGIIGHGSSGQVTKVIHTPTNTVLALKTVAITQNDTVQQNLHKELMTLTNVRSDQIVSFYNAFCIENRIEMVMEFMDLGALGPPRFRIIPEAPLRLMAVEMMRGLAHMHARHFIHRDIKPANILINSRGEVKLTDFGVSAELAHTLAQAESWVGTLVYMAPERINGDAYSFAADVWSLGLTVMELAMGRFPLATGDADVGSFLDVMNLIVSNPPPILPDGFTPEFRDFCAVCLTKNIAARPTAAALLQHPWLAPLADMHHDAICHEIKEYLSGCT